MTLVLSIHRAVSQGTTKAGSIWHAAPRTCIGAPATWRQRCSLCTFLHDGFDLHVLGTLGECRRMRVDVPVGRAAGLETVNWSREMLWPL